MTEFDSWITDDQYEKLAKYDKVWAKMLRVGKFTNTTLLGFNLKSARRIGDYGSCVVGIVLGKTHAEYSTEYNCKSCAHYSDVLFECYKRGAKNEFSVFLGGFLDHVRIAHKKPAKAQKRLAL